MIASGLLAISLSAQTDHPTLEGTTPLGPITQYRTWSIGLNAGVLNQSNLFGFNRAGFDNLNHNVGYSAYVKYHLSPSFGLKAQYLGGKVGGVNDDADIEFETKTPWSAALMGEYVFGNANWRVVNNIVKPYVAFGVGALNFEPTITVSGAEDNRGSETKLYVPVDVGVKFAIARGINLDLGYQLNWANQGFDGFRGGQYNNDLFSYAHAGLEIALGDAFKPFLGNSNPVATLINDYGEQYDRLKADHDALVATNNDLKAQLSQINTDLQDDDGDGVPNKFDKCPNTPQGTTVDGSGCPIEVRHETKVIEQIIVTEEDKKVVDEAIKNLEFDLGKATIRPTSYESLNRVATLLIEKNFSLRLAGHTDNTGSMEVNLRLSKERAESVKAYLVSKGANSSRIEATGFGPTQPIATNATAEGRQQNRRVEFTLY